MTSSITPITSASSNGAEQSTAGKHKPRGTAWPCCATGKPRP